MVGHEDGVGHCYEGLAQAERFKDAARASVTDDERCGLHVLCQRGRKVKVLHTETVCVNHAVLPFWHDVARYMAARSYLVELT